MQQRGENKRKLKVRLFDRMSSKLRVLHLYLSHGIRVRLQDIYVVWVYGKKNFFRDMLYESDQKAYTSTSIACSSRHGRKNKNYVVKFQSIDRRL